MFKSKIVRYGLQNVSNSVKLLTTWIILARLALKLTYTGIPILVMGMTSFLNLPKRYDCNCCSSSMRSDATSCMVCSINAK